MNLKSFFLFVAVTILFSLNVYADDYYKQNYYDSDSFAISPKVGTLGAGLEGIVNLNDNFNARLGVNAFEYDDDGEESNIDYDIDIDLFSLSALVDWFPFGGCFRVTGGAMFNQNEAEVKAKSSANYDIGGTTYSLAQVGTLKGKVDFDEFAPYFGIGWGNPFGKKGNWSFAVDLGVMYQGTPNVALSTNGTSSALAPFIASLAAEQKQLENEIDGYEYYPVISIATTYRF